MTAADWLARLRASGYRLTAARRAVVQVLTTSKRALNPAEVFDRASERHPALGLVSVYRTLERLQAPGLVQRVHLPQGCHAYWPAADGRQHLLICEACGTAEYFAGDDLDSRIASVERESGYRVEEHWLQLLGACTECK